MENDLKKIIDSGIDIIIGDHYVSFGGGALNLVGYAFEPSRELESFTVDITFGEGTERDKELYTSYFSEFNYSNEEDKKVIKEVIDFCKNETGTITLKVKNREDYSFTDGIYLTLHKYKFNKINFGFTSFLCTDEGAITKEESPAKARASFRFKITEE